MDRFAFTMLELVFVIVVVGILGAVLVPKYDRNKAGEAAYQVARHIRLAQHHALVEDRVGDPDDTRWQKTLWRIAFIDGTSGQCYNVFADRDANGGNPHASERAVDPLTHKYLWGGTTCSSAQNGVNQGVLLWKSFGVEDVTLCSGAKHIAFDHLGRPGKISGNTFNPLIGNCVVKLKTFDEHTAEVTVYQETGYVKVTKINGEIL